MLCWLLLLWIIVVQACVGIYSVFKHVCFHLSRRQRYGTRSITGKVELNSGVSASARACLLGLVMFASYVYGRLDIIRLQSGVPAKCTANAEDKC